MAFLPMIAIVVVFYFLLIRPQQKRAKETKAMLSALQKGDEVVTAGGVVGRISKLSDAYASVENQSGCCSPQDLALPSDSSANCTASRCWPLRAPLLAPRGRWSSRSTARSPWPPASSGATAWWFSCAC